MSQSYTQTTNQSEETLDDWSIPSYDMSNKPLEEWPVIPEGLYELELVKIGNRVPLDPQYDPEQKKRKALFTFEVRNDPEWEGTKVTGWYTISMHDLSRMLPLVKALMGGKIDPSQPFRPQTLIGRRMQAMLGHRTDKEGRVWPTIDTVMAVRGAQRPPSTQTSPAVEAARDMFDAVDEGETNDVPF